MDIKRKVICGVYVAICYATGEMYVGSSFDVRQRWRQHRALCRGGRHTCSGIQEAWNRNPEKLSFAVLRECSPHQLYTVEQEYIDLLKPTMNRAPVAGTSRGYRMTEEQRARLRRRPQSLAIEHEFKGEHLSVPQIARRAGLTSSAVYAHLRSGKDLTDLRPPTPAQTVVLDGEVLTFKQVAARCGLPLTTVHSRVRLGWPPERLGEPRKHRARNS